MQDLDVKSLLSEEVLDEVFALETEFEIEQKHQELSARAKDLGIKPAFEKLYNAKKRDCKKLLKNTQPEMERPSNLTNFKCLKDKQLQCGDWIADDSGIWIHTDKGKSQACYHPIFPSKILRNAETGQYKVELQFLDRGKIRSALVDKSTIATPSKIVQLANDNIQVTGINAPYLVKYLADLEALNPDLIGVYTSTSRLGWITDRDEYGKATTMFLPYDHDVVFDNEQNTTSLFNSIKAVGSRDDWYAEIKRIRAKRQTELLINLAASYASVLVEPCGALPFIVSLWGGTGIGKTVVLMIVTSVWADPSEGQYMTDAKATATAMEIRLNILNSLPMTLDDMAQIKNQQDEDFSQLIYRWCAGKGRDRSNQNLGLNKLTSWRNCTITNGERSLVDESTQGGAVNRVIDIESSGEALFDGEEGNLVANFVRNNFGYSGKDFIQLLESLDIKEVTATVNGYFKTIKSVAAESGVEKEDKQIIPMALILTADELTERYLFQDGVRLDVNKCVSYLKNKGEVNEHKRAYEYIVDRIESERFHFADKQGSSFDRPVQYWGFVKDDHYVAVLPSIFDKLLKEGSFQPRAFKSWALKNDLIQADNGRLDKQIKINGSTKRYIVLKTNDSDGFMEVSDGELPFE